LPRKTALDRITLTGVRLMPRIGTSAEERAVPQLCEADITLWGDFEAAAATDSLDKAIDYSRMLAKAEATAVAGEYNLLEALAYRIARAVLQDCPAHKVGVRIRKRPASLTARIDFVEIEIEES
jgi:7,8-dihydroneopterin aldolase/epimerase/oxygenase